MSVISALGVMIESADIGYSSGGGNLFEEVDLPNTPNRAVRIHGYGAMPPEFTHDRLDPSYMDPRIQVLVRGDIEEYYAPEQDAHTLYRHLARTSSGVYAGCRIIWVRPLDYPTFLRKDANNRVSYIFNVQIKEGNNDS